MPKRYTCTFHLPNEIKSASQDSCTTKPHAIRAAGNLPGWRWKRIKQLFLVGSSSSLHSEVCNALGGVSASPTAKFLSSDVCVRALSTRPLPLSKCTTDCFSHKRSCSVCVASRDVCWGLSRSPVSRVAACSQWNLTGSS